MQAVYHVRGLEAEADDGPQSRQMDQRPGHSGRVASSSLKLQGACGMPGIEEVQHSASYGLILGPKGPKFALQAFWGY